MERAAREKRASRKRDSWADNAEVLDCHFVNNDSGGWIWKVGRRSFGRHICSSYGIHKSGAIKVINKIFQNAIDGLCCLIMASCFSYSFFMGAYTHVMKEIAMQNLSNMTIAQLMNVEVRV